MRSLSSPGAFAAPFYGSEPKIAPAGQSLIWALAKERGGFDGELHYPEEDEDYEKLPMDQQGL